MRRTGPGRRSVNLVMISTTEYLLTVLFFVSVVGHFAWAIAGSYLSVTLRDRWPDLHARLGSPKWNDFWTRWGFGEFPLKELMRKRQFRRMGINNDFILLLLEIHYWTFWISNLSIFTFAAILIFVYPYLH